MADILIVDDDRLITGLITGILNRLGHNASAAPNLESGLAKAHSENLDIALIDVNLPDRSGSDSLSQFKEAPMKPEVFIITGEGTRIDAERAYQSGAWDYIEKPFHRVDLELSIARALEYRGRKNAAAAPRLLIRDEIGELFLDSQKSLLRILQELLHHFIAGICDDYQQGTKGCSLEFLKFLVEYHWPGNVRELYNTLEYAIASAGNDPILHRIHLPGALKSGRTRLEAVKPIIAPTPPQSAEPEHESEIAPLKVYRQRVIEKAERTYLETLMAHTNGNVKKACRVSEISAPRLYALLKKYQIKAREF